MINGRYTFYNLRVEIKIGQAVQSSAADPIEQFPAISWQNVHVLRCHQKTQEADSEDFGDGQHRDSDGLEHWLPPGLCLP